MAAATVASPRAAPPVAALPPGPDMTPRAQQLAWIVRPEWLLERTARERGAIATVHLPLGPVVMVADPGAIRELFAAGADTLRAGEGNSTLEPVVGRESVLLLDGPRHLARRRLLLPAFHGERLAHQAAVIARLTEEEVARWPLGEPFALEPRMRAITLDVIVRLVFGITDDARAGALRDLLPRMVPDGGASSLLLFPALRRDLGPGSPWRRFAAMRAAVDRLLFDEIARRRRDPALAERDDVLSMLLLARTEDGAGLEDRQVRDELMTLLLAGHETTATALSWTFELLHRNPAALERAREEARAVAGPDARGAEAGDAGGRAGGGGTPWIDACVQESLRLKPPLPMAVRKVVREIEVLGHRLPVGARVAPAIYMTHRRADLHPQPTAFRPERFLAGAPESFAWLPFGGGVRRCAGAAFAQLELRTIVRTVLARAELRPASPHPERSRRRAIVLAPRHGARAVLLARRG